MTALVLRTEMLSDSYASEMALVGHTEAQVPQLTHLPASISRWLSFSEIAPTGQSGSQVPQFMQVLGSIFIAIILPLEKCFVIIM